MADDLNQVGEPDRSRINIHEDHEVAYWTKALSVTREELERAVKEVGPEAEKVRMFLSR